jgi:hypothetical protein
MKNLLVGITKGLSVTKNAGVLIYAHATENIRNSRCSKNIYNLGEGPWRWPPYRAS